MKVKIFYLTLTISLFINSFYCNSQVIAYPSINDSKVLGASCADLHYVNPIVVGHQLNVSVTYYETLPDAQNEANPLDRFYEPLSNPQTIYARVDSNLNSFFAIEECIIDSAEALGGPPPGITPCYFDVCDSDNNGNETINLDKLRCKYDGYGFPTTSFCNSSTNEVETTYYLSESDAMNEVNPINPIYTITGAQNFYRKIKNINTNEFLIDDLINVNLISCSVDTDMDGIADLNEDVNGNLLYTEDDTDQDGLKNFEDDDDDGDGILTINEDYNNNGDPTDDDTNLNGIADYLESNVTLNTVNFLDNKFSVYPNPVSNFINIQSKSQIKKVEIYNSIGQLLKSERHKINIDFSNYLSGVYFIKILDEEGNSEIKKLIKE